MVVPVAVIGWVAWLVAADIGSGATFIAGASLLATVNVTVGALLHLALRWGMRSFHKTGRAANMV